VVRAYLRFLTKYGRLQTRISVELDHDVGSRLPPPLFNFHIQLAIRNWLVLQIDSTERGHIEPPNFSSGLDIFDSSHNLMWAPSVTSIPDLLILRVAPHHPRTRAPPSAAPSAAPTARTAIAPAPSPAEARTTGRMVRNTNRDNRFTANTPFARNVRARRVVEAIALAGAPPPEVVR
jgi:hypothetical protein